MILGECGPKWVGEPLLESPASCRRFSRSVPNSWSVFMEGLSHKTSEVLKHQESRVKHVLRAGADDSCYYFIYFFKRKMMGIQNIPKRGGFYSPQNEHKPTLLLMLISLMRLGTRNVGAGPGVDSTLPASTFACRFHYET